MNKNVLSFLALSIILSHSTLFITAKNYWFDDPFDSNIFVDFDRIHEHFINDIKRMEDSLSHNNYNYNHNSQENKIRQEDNQKARQAQAKLDSITPEITKDKDGNIEIAFPIANINKDAIEDITLKDNMLVGQLDSDYGSVKFYITDQAIKLVRNLEIKEKEEQKPDQQESDNAGKSEAKSFFNYHYSYGSSNIYSLPVAVDINNASAQIKDDNLVIKLSAKNYSKIKIQK